MGKLGIIFAFLLSVAAAGGSYYLYQGWVEERTVRGTLEAKYDQVKEKMITVQSEKEQIKAEKEQIAAKSEEYRTKAEAMQSQLESLQAEQKRIDSEKAVLEKQLKSHQTMIAELQAKMGELEKKAKDAQAACGVTPADMNADPFAASRSTGKASSMTSSSTTGASGAGASQLVFKPATSGGSIASEPFVASAKPAAPAAPETSAAATAGGPSSEVSAIAGTTTGPKVLTVNRKFNFVVINQGLQDGLKMGDKLKVLKQGKEIATVQVEKLYDKFSAATLVEEDPNQQVIEGDEIRKA